MNTTTTSSTNPQSTPRGEIGKALRSLRGAWVAVAIFSMVANVMLLAPTIYMLQVYDRVMVSGSELTLLAVSLIVLLLLAFMAFADAFRARLLVRMGARIDSTLGARIFSASFARSTHERGVQPAQPLTDWTELRQFMTGPSMVTLFDLPWTPIYLVALFLLHPILGWVALGFALIQAALAWFGHQRTVAPSEELGKAQAHSHTYLHGKLRNAEAVESMGMLQPLRQRWLQLHANYGAQHARLQRLTQRVTASSKYVRYAQQTASLAVGALLVINGELSPGAMIAANVLMARALAPIDQLVSIWRGLLSARGAHQRLAALLAEHPPQPEGLATTQMRGKITARNLDVCAPGRDQKILQSLNFDAPAGSLNVVLGVSGSGKSTLARTLAGVWQAEQPASLLLDDQPLSAWSAEARGSQTGYLPQDTALFNGTVAQNIARFGKLDADKVVAAARCAGLHEMVLKFPKGYETQVGDGGKLLSGGQRQRIGLARALYGEPMLLVLDEPNAHLDDSGEAALLEALRQTRERGATVFLITHRAGVITMADRLIVLQNGRMQCSGPRDEVLPLIRAPSAQPPALPPQALPA